MYNMLFNVYISLILQVVTEGYLAFGEPFFSSEPFFFPSDLIQNFTIVAPFFANVDNNLYENSNISYEVHSGSSPVMEAVSMFIKEREGVAFSGTWMLLAEWKEVPLFSGPPTEVCTHHHWMCIANDIVMILHVDHEVILFCIW